MIFTEKEEKEAIQLLIEIAVDLKHCKLGKTEHDVWHVCGKCHHCRISLFLHTTGIWEGG